MANDDTPPPLPEELVIPDAILADDFALEKCTYPVEGFVEAPLKEKPDPSFAYVMHWEPPKKPKAGPAVGKKRVLEDDLSDSEVEAWDLLPDTDDEHSEENAAKPVRTKPMSKAEGKKPMRQMANLSVAEKRVAEIERARSLRKLFEQYAVDAEDPFGFGV